MPQNASLVPLIGEPKEEFAKTNGRPGRLGVCGWLTTEFRKLQVWQVWKFCSTFCSDRWKAWRDLERFSFLFVKLWKRGEFARAATVIGSYQSSFPSTRLVFVFFDWKLSFHRNESEFCCFKEFCVSLGTVFPSLRNLLFSEFGRSGVSNQTHPVWDGHR